MFIESPRFPDDISYGVTGGAEFLTDMATNPGGFSISNATRDMPLHSYDAAQGLRHQAQFLVLKNLFMNVRGMWGGFRFKDWQDFQVSFANGQLVPVSPGVYQLYNSYPYGAYSFLRIIRKPVAGTVVVQRNAMTVPVGAVTAGNYTLDTTTGLVTFVPDATRAVSGITVGSSTTIALASSIGSPTTLALAGFTGADAGLLNGQSFPVSAVAGVNYTLAVNTLGKSISAATTTASVYPSSSDVLTWAGEFDVPVKFATDKMLGQIESFDGHSWSQIPLLEWRNPS